MSGGPYSPATGAGRRRVVRVAVVGLGWAAKSIWLPRLHEHPGFTISAIVDPDPAALAGAVHGLGGTELLSSVDDLSPDMADLAVVAVPNHLHATIACRLLGNGIPVFVEKPVCLDSHEARQLAAAESASGSVLLAGSAARYRADILALRDTVAGLGDIRHVEVSWVRARGIPDAGGWFTHRQLSGGGALVDLGWHLLDTVAPLFGDGDGAVGFDQALGTVSDDFVRDSAARAAWREQAPDEVQDAGGDVEDTARGFLVTDTGVSVGLRASWASHEPYDVTEIRVDGSAGSARLRCTFGFSPNRVPESELTVTRDGVVSDVPFTREPVGAEYMRQLDALPGLLADPASRGRAVRETLRTITVIERIYASAREARTAPATPSVSVSVPARLVASSRTASPVRAVGAPAAIPTAGPVTPAPTLR
ncbi:Gfo/Idh/MocA family protein [Streptomyces sp. TRM64462]|uniref:Gfo/Idh/MocA family protein n=1 Tax=Streptomyces sp. TRM64462 TaxID=2741726 RepID=UPI001585ED9F|nr:Gfo/Idh/MocA family oxidoreductase [Streptomyces sp. TRM64462]